MKTIAVLIALMLFIGMVSAKMDIDSPDTLKITIKEPYGQMKVISAWLNTSSGTWTVAYIDSIEENLRFYVGNETGYVTIT